MYISDNTITSKHYLALFVCTFAAGILFATSFGIVFSLAFSLLAAVLCSIVFIILKFTGVFKTKYFILSVLLIISAILGILRIYVSEHTQYSFLRKYSGQEVWICGIISSSPHLTSTGHYYSFELDTTGIADHTGSFGTIMMYIPKTFGCDFNSGDSIYAWTSLNVPESSGNSPHFDYCTQLRGRNIFVTGTAKNINLLTNNNVYTPLTVYKSIGVWMKNKVSNSIQTVFYNNSVYSAVLKGILIGDKSGFDDSLYQKFSYSGISHIVAVSGLHMSILFSFLMVISRQFRITRNFSLLAIIPAVSMFMSASGFTPSVCRASIMMLIMVFSAMFREEYNSVTALSLSLGLTLAISPYSLFSKSLILSFCATLGIFIYFPHLNNILNWILNLPKLKLNKCRLIRRTLSYFADSFALSLSSLAYTAYFLALFWDGISKVQFLTNLWAIPLVSVIFCLGYTCCVFYYICPWIAVNLLKPPLGLCLEIIRFTVEKFGVADNVLYISGQDLTLTSAIVYFVILLIFYILLKTLSDFLRGSKIY